MSLVALMLLLLLAGSAFSFPLDIGGDYGFGGSGGYGGLGGWGGVGGWGGYGGLGYDYDADVGYPVGYGSSYVYGGYPRTVDYSRSNYVRGSYIGGTEVGTRNEITVRPSYVGVPYSRFYTSYYPYFSSGYPYGGYYLPSASLLGRVSGDTVYLKR